MTAVPGPGTALDRIGGRLRLAGFAEEFRGHRIEIGLADSPRHYVLAIFDQAGAILVELRSVEIARSSAVAADQLRLMVDDMRELRGVLREILAEREEASIPELEKRALDGDR
jgi:hypothetical protein